VGELIRSVAVGPSRRWQGFLYRNFGRSFKIQ